MKLLKSMLAVCALMQATLAYNHTQPCDLDLNANTTRMREAQGSWCTPEGAPCQPQQPCCVSLNCVPSDWSRSGVCLSASGVVIDSSPWPPNSGGGAGTVKPEYIRGGILVSIAFGNILL